MLTAFHQPRLGYHVLRLSVAGMMLMHGISKLIRGVDGIEGMLSARGLPAWLAYGVYLGEVVAPVLAIANVWVQAAGIVMAVNMVFAILLVHAGDIFTLKNSGAWGVEVQALFLFGSVALALLARPGQRG
jgi:putative oxidoreductase